VLGKMVRINGHAFPVVGVAPAGFFGVDVGRAIDVYLPITAAVEIGAIAPGMMTGRFSTWLQLLGRLEPGVDERRAAARLTVLLQNYMKEAVGELERSSDLTADRRQRLLAWQASLEPLGRGYGTTLRSRVTTPLTAATVLVGLVLALVSTNVGCLLLARAVARRREISIRLSLGATRTQIGRQVVIESALLAIVGACGALLLAPSLASIAVRQLPTDLGPISLDVSLNWRLLGIAAALSVLTTALVSLAAVIHATRQRPAHTLKLAGAGVTERLRIGPQRTLVGLQVALCVIVLVVAALFVQTLRNLDRVNLGVSSDQVLIASVDPSSVGYSAADLQALYRTIQDRLTALPEVSAASLILGQPFLLRRGSSVEIDGRDVNLRWEVVAPHFFETLGMSLKAGRDFARGDAAAGPFVAIVNETLANQQFSGRNPVGEYIYTSRFDGMTARSIRTSMEIVGVVRDVIHRSPRDQARPVLYAPVAQATIFLSPATVVVRSSVAPMRLVDTVRQTISRTDPNLALFDIKTFEQQVGETIWAERLLARAATGFSLTALVLAGLGIFGTLSHGVTRRAKEIGVRMAIGADARTIRRSVVRESLLLCAAGAVAGVPLALAGTRYLTSVLYGVQPGDWRALLGAITMLTLMAAVAAYLPARRASQIDPMRVLRAE
jgi:predicted permease